jgi:hypothetical protein
MIDEVKSSAILSVSWEDLILTAPVALSCLGACFVASSSDKAETTKVAMVAGATVGRPEYLSMNLNDCANLGLNAFLQAERGLLKMRQLSVMAQNKVRAPISYIKSLSIVWSAKINASFPTWFIVLPSRSSLTNISGRI